MAYCRIFKLKGFNMAFTQSSFILDRGAFNTISDTSCFAMHRYISATDLIDDIQTVGYFPPWFGYDGDVVKTNDYLQVQSSDGNSAQYIISVDTSGNIDLNVDEIPPPDSQLILIPSLVTGISSPPAPITLKFYVQGGIVHFYLPAFLQPAAVASIAGITPNIPAYLCPADPIIIQTFVCNFGFATDFGVISISTSGVIQLGWQNIDSVNITLNYFQGETCGWQQRYISWPNSSFQP
jgi:hypothetical protein